MRSILFLGIWSILILAACGTLEPHSTDAKSLEVAKTDADTLLQPLIFPYRSELDKEMGLRLAYAPETLVKGRPNAGLNNWCADAVLSFNAQHFSDSLPVVVLLNTGGLRSTLNQGVVSLGDIYKLMPFDNELVRVRMPIQSLKEIEAYLIKSGGEPIAGMQLTGGELRLNQDSNSSSFLVITSDYLLNGGDKMYFFEQRLDWQYAGVLLRDVFIEVAKNQDTLHVNHDKRIAY